MKVNKTHKILVTVLTTCMLMVSGAFGNVADAAKKPVVAEGLQGISVKGSTDLPGHFFLSFAFSRNLIMLDGKGNIVWSKRQNLLQLSRSDRRLRQLRSARLRSGRTGDPG